MHDKTLYLNLYFEFTYLGMLSSLLPGQSCSPRTWFIPWSGSWRIARRAGKTEWDKLSAGSVGTPQYPYSTLPSGVPRGWWIDSVRRRFLPSSVTQLGLCICVQRSRHTLSLYPAAVHQDAPTAWYNQQLSMLVRVLPAASAPNHWGALLRKRSNGCGQADWMPNGTIVDLGETKVRGTVLSPVSISHIREYHIDD